MKFAYQWDLPSDPRPIVLIGAGGIVNDAHLPGYQIAKFPVLGIHDINSENLQNTARKWGLASYKDIKGLIDPNWFPSSDTNGGAHSCPVSPPVKGDTGTRRPGTPDGEVEL